MSDSFKFNIGQLVEVAEHRRQAYGDDAGRVIRRFVVRWPTPEDEGPRLDNYYTVKFQHNKPDLIWSAANISEDDLRRHVE